MNNKVKKLIITFFTFLFAIFLLIIFIKERQINKSGITNMDILNYIPSNYEFTIISNSTNNNIKKYINKNVSEKKRDEINIIKDSIISYLGFNLQEKIKDIYDNEFALTFFENKSSKKDILLIIKFKKHKDINDIINIKEDLNKSNQIIELNRIGKLSYISHIFLTNDNYLIASSNKKLIDNALQSNNNISKLLSRNLMPNDINLKEIKLLSISKYITPQNDSNLEPQIANKLITIVDLEDDKIKLRTFSQNIDIIKTQVLNNQIDIVKDIIFTNKYSPYKQSIDFLYKNINQRYFIEEILQELDEQLLYITKNNNWVLCFSNKSPNSISIGQFNIFKKFKKEDLYINNIHYSIYTNNSLKIKDNNIIYEKENPIFSLEDELNTYISNNFDALINISEKATLSYKDLINHEIKPYKYISNDMFFIKNINNEQLIKYYKALKNLQYFINTKLFSFEDISINISQTIPERNEKIYVESNFKIL